MFVPFNVQSELAQTEEIECQCGRTWNVVMERGEPNQCGCIRCSCGEELMAWSGTIAFSALERLAPSVTHPDSGDPADQRQENAGYRYGVPAPEQRQHIADC
jgi:hypothetical protein